MAITIGDVASPPMTAANGLKLKIFDIAMDSSYPTGGEAITAADLGFTTIVGLFGGATQSAATTSGRICSWSNGNGTTTGKMLVIEDAGAAGAFREAPNTTNLTTGVTTTFRVLAIGT